MTHRWVHVGPCASIPVREGRLVRLFDRDLAIFNLGDRYLAVDNRCPHRGGPLADGIVTGTSVVCPLHAWKVDLQRGCVERPSSQEACVATYPVKVEEGAVLVGVPAPTEARAAGEAA